MQKTNINLGGVTRVPDDTMSQNGDLALALNLAADGDGLKMLEKPVPLFQLRQGETVLCVHQNDGYKHYITSYDGKLWWWGESAGEWSSNEIGTSGATQATVMGNTVITQGSKMEYWLWDEGDGGYRQLNQQPGRMNLQFGLHNELVVYPHLTSSNTLADPIEIVGNAYTDEVPLPYWGHTKNNYDLDDLYSKPVGRKADGAQSGKYWDEGEGQYYNPSFNEWDFSLENATGKSEESDAAIQTVINSFSDQVMSAINKYITNQATEEGKFVFPFFVRYCYELYDGSQIMESDPVLLVPNSRSPQFLVSTMELYRVGDGKTYEKVRYRIKGRVAGIVSKLCYSMKANETTMRSLVEWKDLLKSLAIYVSAPIYTYDQAGKVYGWRNMEAAGAWDSFFSEGRYAFSDGNATTATYGRRKLKDLLLDYKFHNIEQGIKDGWCVMRVPEKTLKSIRNDALSQQFYKLAEIPIDDLCKLAERHIWPSFSEREIDLEPDVLATLTNRIQLVESYTALDELSAGVQYVYNRRLHIGAVSRRLGELAPLAVQLPIYKNDWGVSGAGAAKERHAVEILHEQQTIIIASPDSTTNTLDTTRDKPLWLYNGNADASRMIVKWVDGVNYAYPLVKHPSWKGSYWLSGEIWNDSENSGNSLTDLLPTYDDQGQEITPPAVAFPESTGGTITTEGEVWTSNVENPFVFQAGNVNQVGDGKVLALRAAVAPLAEDQHGYAPMYAFTSQGIWAMTHSKDGTPAAIDHICGDIITEGTEPLNLLQSCLVMTGRGLLELTGRSVRNLSAKIDGEFASDLLHEYAQFGNVLQAAGIGMFDQEFAGIIGQPLRGKVCKLSYDYQHQRVYVWLSRGGWVLNLRTGLWTQTSLTVDHVYNAYPGCEFARSPEASTGYESVVVSLDTEDAYDYGVVATRPIKLSEHLFKLREVAVRGFFDPDLQGDDAQVWTVLHGSRNWHDYGLVGSAKGDRVTRLGGSAYRSYAVTALLRSDSASIDRLVLSAEEEQGNKLR